MTACPCCFQLDVFRRVVRGLCRLQANRTLENRLVALGLQDLPGKRAAAKAQRLFIRLRSCAHCGSDASHDPLFSLQTRRTLWKLGMSAKPTTFIRDLARVSQARHGALLKRSASIAGGSAIRSRASSFEIHCYEQAYQRRKKRKVSATRKARRDFERPEVCSTLR